MCATAHLSLTTPLCARVCARLVHTRFVEMAFFSRICLSTKVKTVLFIFSLEEREGLLFAPHNILCFTVTSDTSLHPRSNFDGGSGQKGNHRHPHPSLLRLLCFTLVRIPPLGWE